MLHEFNQKMKLSNGFLLFILEIYCIFDIVIKFIILSISHFSMVVGYYSYPTQRDKYILH